MITDLVYINDTVVTVATHKETPVRKLDDTYFFIRAYLERHGFLYQTVTDDVILTKYDLVFETKVNYLKNSILLKHTKNIRVLEEEKFCKLHFIK